MKVPGWISKTVQIPPSAKWDVVLLPALFLFNLFNFSSWFHLGYVPASPWLIIPWVYGIFGLFLLVWRNRAPIISFVTQWVLAMAAWPFMTEYIPVVGIPVALYVVSFHRGRKAAVPALVASFIPSILGAYAASFKVSQYQHLNTELILLFIFNFFFFAAMALGAWFLGGWIGVSQRHQQYLEREQEIVREAEALAEERRKIAREMHDIVSHSVAVILLQAKAATCVADPDFAQITDTKFTQIKQSLAHITTMGTQTMAELRRLLRILETGDDAVHHAKELKPQPGLAELSALLDSLRDVGMPVSAHVKGTPQDLDPGVDLAAYRIVQEGLINILKHAGKDADPQLWLVWKPQSLLIQIDNNMNPIETYRKPTLSAGRGLVGLRERVRAVGGNMNAGSYKSGYRLIATLPFSTPEISLDSDITSSQPHEDQGKVPV
jgi:signal transduction histidine kinase